VPIAPSSEAERRRTRPVLLGWALVWVIAVAVVGFPLFDLGREVVAAGGSTIAEVLGRGGAWGPIVNTVWTALAATALTVAGATAAALVVAPMGGRGRAWLFAGMLLPLLVPPFVSALGWMAAYGPGGVLDDVAGLSASWLVGPAGVVLLLTVNAVPIAFLIIVAALDTRHERDLVRAARVAGATPAEAFRTVTLPLLRPALVAAGAITVIKSANAFGVPAVLGSPAGFGTATTRLYRDLVFSADPAAFDRVLVLASFLAVTTLVVVGIADRSRRAPVRLRVEASGPRLAPRARPRAAVGLVAAYAVTTAVVPLVGLVLTSLNRAVGLPRVPANWTLDNFHRAFAAGAGPAMRNSLLLATVTATIVVALGGLLVALERRRRSGMGTVVALTFAVPGSVLGVSVLLAYGPWLRDTVLIILIAYVAKFWALGHRPIAGSSDATSPELFGAARSSGATPTAAFRTVTLPLLRPALAAGWVIVFVFALHELTISALLYGAGSETLAVAVLNLKQLGDSTVTAALAVVLTVGAAVALTPLAWLARPRGRRVG
jgi:iron(III) transport system permease protein